MIKSLFKVFFSKINEEAWLNSLGQEGYFLLSINDSKYTFQVQEGKIYNYSIQYLDYSPTSDKASEYYNTLKEDKTAPLVSSGNWVYFVNDEKPIEVTADVYKKNSIYYFWRILYLSFFTLLASVVCGYQAFAIKYLSRIGYSGNGQIRSTLKLTEKGTLFEGLFNAFKKFVNFLIRILNAYLRLWTKIFGESDAVIVIAFLIPVILILIAILGNYFNEYISHKSMQKKLTKQQTPETEIYDNEEQGI